MSSTWGAGFNATPAGSEDRRSGDDRIREMKSELWKRLKLLFNFEDDPDGVGYVVDLADDVVQAEHILGVAGTGTITLDKIPDGANFMRVAAAYVDANGRINAVKEANGTRIALKTIAIGDWNMDTDSSKALTHGVADYNKIIAINARVRNDADTALYYAYQLIPGYSVPELWHTISATEITLGRANAGYFDNANFDATSFDRGKVTIWYEE